MSRDPCERERKERDKAYKEWESANFTANIPPSHQQLSLEKEKKPIVISHESEEIIRQAEAEIPLLWKKYLKALEAFINCAKRHKNDEFGT